MSGKDWPRTNRATISPTIRDLEWAAGFLEGEGHFGGPGSQTVVHVTNTDFEPLDKMRRLFGGKVTSREPGPRGKKTEGRWAVYGGRARGLMMTLYTLMESSRRKQQIRKSLGLST